MRTWKLFFFAVILGMFMIPLASAQFTQVFDSYNQSDAAQQITEIFPGAATRAAIGETFNVTVEVQFASVTFNLSKNGNPTGFAQAFLYHMNTSRTFGVNGTPDGAAIAESDQLDVSTLVVGVPRNVTFNFTGSNQVQLNISSQYCIVLQSVPGSVINAGNNIAVYVDTTAPTYPGNEVTRDVGAWATPANVDVQIVLRRVTLWSSVGEALDSAFNFWGIADFMDLASDYITGLADYFSSSMTNLVDLVVQEMRLILAFFSSYLKVFTGLVDSMLTLWNTAYSIVNDTNAFIDLGIGNFWDWIAFATWQSAFYILLIVFWIDGLDKRAKTTGRNTVNVIIGDVNQGINLTSFFLSTFAFLLNEVANWALKLFDAVSGVIPV